MLNFLLVGAGQLGSRHLQALALADFSDICIQVVEPSAQARKVAQERWEQVAKSENIKSIEFLADMSKVNSSIDFCIIATNANCRLQVLKDLFTSTSVRQLVLEKVLFQSVAQLQEASRLLASLETKAWVNCPRRMFPIYQELQKRLANEQTLNLQVRGSNWGLACNAIHFIDLWAMLGGDQNYALDTDGLDVTPVESKRPGYKEVSGTLTGTSGDSGFTLTSTVGSETEPLSIRIETENFIVNVNESVGQCKIQTKETAEEEILAFVVLYQSQLSHEIGRQLFSSVSGHCTLTSFNESASLHEPFLSGLLDYFNKQDGHTHTLCPIT